LLAALVGGTQTTLKMKCARVVRRKDQFWANFVPELENRR
jgi:hypothetical protein